MTKLPLHLQVVINLEKGGIFAVWLEVGIYELDVIKILHYLHVVINSDKGGIFVVWLCE